ncbi:hypothetical protein Tco_0669374 [Tanacetum coccineum]
MASVVPPAGPLLTTGVAPNIVEEEETVTDAPHVSKRRRKRANEESNANAPRKVLRKDFDVSHPTQSTVGGKSLASISLGASSTVSAPASQETPTGTMNPDPISFAEPSSVPEQDIAQLYVSVLDPCLPRELPLQEDQMIQVMKGEKKNLETLLEAEADMRKAAEAKNAELVQEMESLRAQFTELQVSRDGLSHQVSTLQAQVTGEEKIKAEFEEFKKYEDERVSARCAKTDSRLDALSIDFDEELYPHMLTAIAGRRWVIGHGLRLAVLKCAESLELRQTFTNVVSAGITKGFYDGLKYEVEQGEAKLDLAMVEGYDPEAKGKFIATMQALKDLKYPLINELEKLKDSPMDLYDSRLPEVRDPLDPWVLRMKCYWRCNCSICSDGVPVYVPTAVPQGLAILLADAATQTDVSEVNSSPQLTRSKSLPSCKTLD